MGSSEARAKGRGQCIFLQGQSAKIINQGFIRILYKYLFLSGFSSLYDVIHGWRRDEWMDESQEKASRKMTTMSLTICN
jgi:hypothetical protein